MILLQRIWNLPAGRIATAIALSLLIHTLLLFGPNFIALAPVEVPLPPLTARLEPLPAVKAAPPKKHHRKPEPAPKPVAPVETGQPEIPHAQPEFAAGQPEAAPVASQPEAATEATESPAALADATENAAPSYPLPRHAQLTFVAFLGTNFPVGEVHHRLEIDESHHYTLQVNMTTTGFASLFKTFALNQQSIGSVGALGLRPDIFSEVKVTSNGKQTLSAEFDWQNKRLSFSSGNSTALPEQTQDILSFLYQFSQMPLDRATLPMRVSNGRKLESYQLEVGAEEEIVTRLGKLRTLHLTKIHAPAEEGLEIWLGLEYRLLPVKIRQIDRDGKTAGELVISEIRVSEE